MQILTALPRLNVLTMLSVVTETNVPTISVIIPVPSALTVPFPIKQTALTVRAPRVNVVQECAMQTEPLPAQVTLPTAVPDLHVRQQVTGDIQLPITEAGAA